MQSYNNDKTTIEQMPWKITHTHVISFVYMHSPPKNHAESLVDPDLRLRWGGGLMQEPSLVYLNLFSHRI